MPTIEYQADQFGPHWGSKLFGTNTLSCTWADIVRASITVGRIKDDVWRHGIYSIYDNLYRLFVIFANLMENRDGKVIRSPSYVSLDPSEKGVISYYLGMTTAKLISERLLQTPWLFHLDNYSRQFKPKVNGRSKPDLIGLDNSNRWIVVEAKGRSHSYDVKAMLKAKEQTRKLASINGKSPILRVAVQSFFREDELQINIQDPLEFDSDAEDFEIDVEQTLRNYYNPILEYLQSTSDISTVVISNREYVTNYIEVFDFKIGLNKKLFRFLSERSIHYYNDSLESFIKEELVFTKVTDKLTSVGMDGFLVIVGDRWSDGNMKKLPYERF